MSQTPVLGGDPEKAPVLGGEPEKKIVGLPARRPAEFTAVAAALALLIASLFGLDDPGILTALAVVIGFIPTAVTTAVEYVRSQRGSG